MNLSIRTTLVTSMVAVSLLSLFATSSWARPVVPISKPAPQNRLKFDTRQFMPESDLKYGQTGYALTVFHGTKVQRFSVRILGVLKKVNNGKDLILFRVLNGPSVTRQINIAAGMSGSPVYVGGRMVGAIAYGLPFGREPIGLITPIRDMLDSWDPDLPAHPGLSAADERKGLQSESVAIDSAQIAPMAGGTSGVDLSHGPLTFEPMMTPLAAAGMTPEGIARLAVILAPYHLMPVAGGGMGSENLTPAQSRAAAKSLVPGAAVGVSLAQGDIDLTAIGTLTYRDGDKVVAFGHPFTGMGPIDAALTTASITDIYPSYEESTKLGMPLATVGRIFQDRPFSVGGTIGPRPQMIPVNVVIDDQSDRRHKTFHARILNHPLLTGILAMTVANEAILEAHGTPGDAVAYVTTDVDADQVGHIVRHNVFFDPLAINTSAVGDLSSIVQLLSSNSFYQLAVKSVNIDVRIQDRHATAQIDHIVVPRGTYQPGDTIDVGVVLRPYKQDQVVKQISLKIPSNAPNGTVILSVDGGAVSAAPTLTIGTGGAISVSSQGTDPSKPPAATVQQLVKQFLEEPKNNDLVTSLDLPSSAPEVGGEKLSILPPTMVAIMRAQHASALKMAHDEVKNTTAMPWVVTGSQQLSINIVKKNDFDLNPDVASTPPPANPDAVTPLTPRVSTPNDGSVETLSTDPVMITDPEALPQATAIYSAATKGSPAPVAGPTRAQSPAASSPAPTSVAASDSLNSTMLPPLPPPTPTPVARVASIWRQNTESAFDNGTLDGVAVTSAPDLRISPSIELLGATSSSSVWSQAYDSRGDLYIGTGDDGLIFRIDARSTTPVLFARTHELEVTALAFNNATGDLYAATAPHGIVFRVTAAGRVVPLAQIKDPYIPAILLDRSGRTLYLATGGGTGRIYGVDLTASGTVAKLIFTSPDVHLLCLAQGAGESLYTGGNPNGVVYKLDPSSPDTKGKIVYDSPGPTISAIAIDPTGDLYVGTAPSGAVYRVDLNHSVAPQLAKTEIAKTADFVTGLCVDTSGTVWASAGDTLYRIAPDRDPLIDDVFATFPSNPDVAYTNIAASPSGGVTAGTASIGAIYGYRTGGIGAKTLTGSYTSAIHDSRLKANWGTISWAADAPSGSQIELQTRTGDVPQPDGTWSDWETALNSSLAGSAQIISPPARFIQYKALLTQSASASRAATPKLSSVSVYCQPSNRPPSVRISAPQSGDALSGSVTLRWSGTDPDRDTLSYELYISSNGGQTWTKLDTGGAIRQKSAPSASPAVASASGAATITASGTGNAASVAATNRKLADELAKHPEIPAAVRAKMLADDASTASAPPALPAGTVTAAESAELRGQSYSWNTKQATDGVYQFKVVASDEPSNDEDALTDEAVSAPFTIVNTPPTVIAYVASAAASSSGISVRGVAASNLVFVKAVQYKVDDGPWTAAQPLDGIYDSMSEAFSFTVPSLTAGAHQITVEAFDRAGNTATQTLGVE